MQFLGMLLLILFFVQCQQAPQASETPPSPAELAEALDITINCDMPLPPGCKDFHEDNDKLKVKPACAKAFIDYWQCFCPGIE